MFCDILDRKHIMDIHTPMGTNVFFFLFPPCNADDETYFILYNTRTYRLLQIHFQGATKEELVEKKTVKY